jgi:hypothetical protein
MHDIVVREVPTEEKKIVGKISENQSRK